jgi:hypothetical protein
MKCSILSWLKKKKEKDTLKKIHKKNEKRAVSEMVAYVILISIAMGIAGGVYAWLRYIPNSLNETVDCKDGTSVTIDGYFCDNVNKFIEIDIKNNGRFNVDGVIVHVGDNSAKVPIDLLKPDVSGGTLFGHYDFSTITPLKPGETNKIKFYYLYKPLSSEIPYDKDRIRIVKVQAFIRNPKKVVCKDAVFTDYNVPECKVNEP